MDDLARLLAGLPGRPGSVYAELEASDGWKEHAGEFDLLWRRFEAVRLPEMVRFQRAELMKQPFRTADVFYPFGGPDALTVTTFYPGSNTYTLLGLEPPGTLPDRRLLRSEKLGLLLPQLRATLKSILQVSFFVTRQMDHQFRGQVTDGLLLPILVQLARTGHRVIGIQFIGLDAGGSVAERHAEEKQLNWGMVIEFEPELGGGEKRLYYYSLNLITAKLAGNLAFLKFMEKQKPVVTFLKSTSYMTHKPEFSLICDKILGVSSAVVQDDSGIPFRMFLAGRWQVQLYGTYDKPYKPFQWRQQKDLKAAYEAYGAKALKLKIGYGYGRIPSNLQVAVRKPATQS